MPSGVRGFLHLAPNKRRREMGSLNSLKPQRRRGRRGRLLQPPRACVRRGCERRRRTRKKQQQENRHSCVFSDLRDPGRGASASLRLCGSSFCSCVVLQFSAAVLCGLCVSAVLGFFGWLGRNEQTFFAMRASNAVKGMPSGSPEATTQQAGRIDPNFLRFVS